MEPLESTIRRYLVDYLAGDTSLDAFVEWLVGIAWTIEETGDPAAQELVYSIQLALAEASSGLLTAKELRSELRALSQHVVLDLAPN